MSIACRVLTVAFLYCATFFGHVFAAEDSGDNPPPQPGTIWEKSGNQGVRYQADSELGVVTSLYGTTGRGLNLDYRCWMTADGKLHVEFKNLKALEGHTWGDGLDDPMEWQWKSIQVQPSPKIEVHRNKDHTRLIVAFDLAFLGERIGQTQKNLGMVALPGDIAEPEIYGDFSVPVYGPIERIVKICNGRRWQLVSHDGVGPSFFDPIPALHTIPEKNFQMGNMTGVRYTGGMSPTGGEEFPSRTFLKSTRGMVRIKRAGGSWEKAKTNMDLNIGDMVKTLSNGWAEVVLAGTGGVKVKPGTEFYIPLGENSKKKVSMIKLVKGFLWAKAKRSGDSLKVATPNAICGGWREGVSGNPPMPEWTTRILELNNKNHTTVKTFRGGSGAWVQPTARREVIDIPAASEITIGPNGEVTLGPQNDIVPVVVAAFLASQRTGNEVHGASILARREGGSARDAITEKTGRDGRAVLQLPGPGKYQIVAKSESHGMAATTADIEAGRRNAVALVFKRPEPQPSDSVSDQSYPSFDSCNKPGWIHATRVVKMTDKRSGTRRQGSGIFTAEIWAQQERGGSLSGTCTYYYKKEDAGGGGGVEGKLVDQPVTGSINNEHVVLQGPGDMEVVGYGNRRTREPVVIFDFMNKFEGTLVDNVYEGPPTSHDKYSVTYKVEHTRIERCVKDEPDEDTDDTDNEPEDNEPGPVSGSFSGNWQVAFYAGPSAGGESTNQQKWKIVVAGNEARSQDSMGRLIQGPLSQNGRVWNADVVMDVSGKTSVVQRLRDLTLSRDGNRFEGKWGGPPPPSGSTGTFHGSAIVGIREGTDDTDSFDTTDETDTTDTTPRHVEVRIQGNGQVKLPVRVAQGGTVEVIVNANNPANPTRHDPPRASSGLQSRGAPERRKIVSRPGMIGGGGETVHYKYAAHRSGTIGVVITRPWDRKPMIDATVQVTVVGGR